MLVLGFIFKIRKQLTDYLIIFLMAMMLNVFRRCSISIRLLHSFNLFILNTFFPTKIADILNIKAYRSQRNISRSF